MQDTESQSHFGVRGLSAASELQECHFWANDEELLGTLGPGSLGPRWKRLLWRWGDEPPVPVVADHWVEAGMFHG